MKAGVPHTGKLSLFFQRKNVGGALTFDLFFFICQVGSSETTREILYTLKEKIYSPKQSTKEAAWH